MDGVRDDQDGVSTGPSGPPLLTRKAFIIAVGAGASTLYLTGCGGGEGGGPASSNGPDVSRTKLTGTFTNQVLQFSQSSEQIGNIWEGQSPALADLKTFAGGGNRAAASRAGGAGVRVMMQAEWYALQGLRSVYERLANGILADDDQGSVAEAITATNSLTANAALTNPQWLAAMMLQTYSAFRVTGALIKILQVAGLQQMQDWVAGQAGNTDKLIAYGVLADTFNTWIDSIQATIKTPSLASSKLDLSAAITAANVAAQLARIATALDAIPYGAGYRAGGTANGIPDDAMLTGSAASNFSLSFLGALAKISLTAGTGTLAPTFPQTVDPTTAHYDVATRLGSTGVGAQIVTLAGSAAAAQTGANALISQLMSTVLPGADGSKANCLVQVASGAYSLVVAVAQAILSDHSLVGAALSGEIALGMLNDEIHAIQSCGSPVQLSILSSVSCDITYLQSTYLVGGNTVALRTIPVVNIPNAVETDQIVDVLALNCGTQMCYPAANAGWHGKPADGTIDLFRQILAGLSAPASAVPRTFNNAEVAAAGLFYDLLFRNQATLKPDFLTSGQFIFCVSNFARLLRRSPAAVTAKLPAITQAALLCSAPNFTPSRSAPVDLATLPSMGPLAPATNLVPGVPIHVQ